MVTAIDALVVIVRNGAGDDLRYRKHLVSVSAVFCIPKTQLYT